jgi:hypothetical protein
MCRLAANSFQNSMSLVPVVNNFIRVFFSQGPQGRKQAIPTLQIREPVVKADSRYNSVVSTIRCRQTIPFSIMGSG